MKQPWLGIFILIFWLALIGASSPNCVFTHPITYTVMRYCNSCGLKDYMRVPKNTSPKMHQSKCKKCGILQVGRGVVLELNNQ